MRLHDFIISHMEPILREWESFAKSIAPQALTMDGKTLRNHAQQMLEAISLDLAKAQSERQQHSKSLGHCRLIASESAAEIHATARLISGFSIEQLFSEYRALRASVLRLCAAGDDVNAASSAGDIMRFNEAIDQAIAESVARLREARYELTKSFSCHSRSRPAKSVVDHIDGISIYPRD